MKLKKKLRSIIITTYMRQFLSVAPCSASSYITRATSDFGIAKKHKHNNHSCGLLNVQKSSANMRLHVAVWGADKQKV